MLPRTRLGACRSPRWRAFSTAESPPPDPDNSPPYVVKKLSPKTLSPSRSSRRAPATRSVFIRPWNGINSPAEAFAIIRGVERKYGRIREFKFLRDSELPHKYQAFFWADFRSTSSFERVPPAGEVIQIPALEASATREGGVGLDDLQELLKPQDRVINAENGAPEWGSVMRRVIEEGQDGKDGKPKVLDVRVERGDTDFTYTGTSENDHLSRNKRLAIGHAFCDWGGFATLKPLAATSASSAATEPSSSGMSSSPSFPHTLSSPLRDLGEAREATPSVDKPEMRTLLTKWSKILRRPDPSVPAPENSQESSPAPATTPISSPPAQSRPAPETESWEWEPLSSRGANASRVDVLETTVDDTPSGPPQPTRRQRLLNRMVQAEEEREGEGAAGEEEQEELLALDAPKGEVKQSKPERTRVRPKTRVNGNKDAKAKAKGTDAQGSQEAVTTMRERIWTFVGGSKWK